MELFFAANKEMQNGFNRAGMKAFWVEAIVQPPVPNRWSIGVVK
ncbi:hypothetical protein [Sideroxyarcus sp. TK5]